MAQDLINKRQNLATNTVTFATQLWDAYQALLEIKKERAQLAQDFLDSDFADTDLKHLTAGMIGSLLDFVVADLDTWFQDGAHPNRVQLTLQVRR
jgi:hypothetical protein